MSTTTMKQWVTTVSALPGTKDEPEMLISNFTVDRDHDRVKPEGVVLTNAVKNLPLLWSHDYRSLPIGTVTAVDVSREGLKARWRWLKGDEFAERVRRAWDQGIVRAADGLLSYEFWSGEHNALRPPYHYQFTRRVLSWAELNGIPEAPITISFASGRDGQLRTTIQHNDGVTEVHVDSTREE